MYHQGDLSYFEAVNKETLKNAYQIFEEESIILVAKITESKQPTSTVRLSSDWAPSRDPETGQIKPEGRLWDFMEMIAQSRREGKNRRDGRTVSSRVLSLADRLGQELYTNNKSDAKQTLALPTQYSRQAQGQEKAHL